MTTLDQMQEDYKAGIANAKHVLLIGQTKVGKSRWVAEIARAGFEVLYLDRDNGIGTLLAALKDDPAAMKRIHYFTPTDMPTFFESLVTLGIYRYNITKQASFSSATASDDDKIVEFRGAMFPKNLVVSIDGWTTLTQKLITNQATKRKVDLDEVDRYSREIYGGVGFRATAIAAIIQHAPFHVVVQAHPEMYELKEKPVGKVGAIDEKDMIIKDVFEIPMSVSKPHGYLMGKHFNEIGWMTVDAFGKRILDFEVKPKRIGGGTIPTKGEVDKTHSFAKLFFPSGVPPIEPNLGIKYMTAGEFKAQKANGTAANPVSGQTQTVIPNGSDSPAPAETPTEKAGLSLSRFKKP